LKPPGTIPRVKLADNLNISRVIRGCWQLDGQHRYVWWWAGQDREVQGPVLQSSTATCAL
jgi:hypothetical protein